MCLGCRWSLYSAAYSTAMYLLFLVDFEDTVQSNNLVVVCFEYSSTVGKLVVPRCQYEPSHTAVQQHIL